MCIHLFDPVLLLFALTMRPSFVVNEDSSPVVKLEGPAGRRQKTEGSKKCDTSLHVEELWI